jgi:hypothetical protein
LGFWANVGVCAGSGVVDVVGAVAATTAGGTTGGKVVTVGILLASSAAISRNVEFSMVAIRADVLSANAGGGWIAIRNALGATISWNVGRIATAFTLYDCTI